MAVGWLTLNAQEDTMVIRCNVGFLFLLASFCVPLTLAQEAKSAPEAAHDDVMYSLSALLDGNGFARIPAGEFQMGSRDGNPDERPVHRVQISRSFEMSKFEVTQAQWEAVMHNPHARPNSKEGTEGAEGSNPSHFKAANRPVDSVSWDDIQQFLGKLNQRDTSYTYRLPTEAEWEYAARAGAKEERLKDLDAAAWHEPNAKQQTHPVGEKEPNAWGLYDMYGNVMEWVHDWYSVEYYEGSPLKDPQGPSTGSYRVYRGCAWLSEAKLCRAAYRGFDFPSPGYYSVGFRVVRVKK